MILASDLSLSCSAELEAEFMNEFSFNRKNKIFMTTHCNNLRDKIILPLDHPHSDSYNRAEGQDGK